MKKSAYTLAEMMLVFGLIGILAIFSIGSIKSREDKYAKMMYNKTHFNLITAVYNIRLELQREVENNPSDPNRQTIDLLSDSEFCNELVKWLNVSSKSLNRCNDNNVMVDHAGTRIVTKGEKDNVPQNYKFVTTNGINWFMAPMFLEQVPQGAEPKRHRVIWIDINGSYGYNTADCSQHLRCDRFAFDIVNEQYVLPLGFPKLDRGYAKAVAKYPLDLDHPEWAQTEIGSYYEEQCATFGCFAGTEENGKIPIDKGVPRYFSTNLYSSVPEDVTDSRGIKPFAGSSLIIPKEGVVDSRGSIKKLGLDLYYREQDPRCVNAKNASFPQCGFELYF